MSQIAFAGKGYISALEEQDEEIFARAFREEQQLVRGGRETRGLVQVPPYCRSFHYYQMYYDNGYYKGYKFYDGDVLIPFSIPSRRGAPMLVPRPWGGGSLDQQVKSVEVLFDTLKNKENRKIVIRDLPITIASKLDLKRKKQFKHFNKV